MGEEIHNHLRLLLRKIGKRRGVNVHSEIIIHKRTFQFLGERITFQDINVTITTEH